MKTVSGVVLSSKPVSLSKAVKILSKFAASDNGASPAYAYYLNSSSESFDELVQLHKELRGADSERMSKKHRSEIRDEVEEPVHSVQNYGEHDKIKANDVAIGKKDVKEKKSRTDAKKMKSTRDENVERRSLGNSDAVENWLFYASSACIYPEFKQLKTTNVSLKESDAWPAEYR